MNDLNALYAKLLHFGLLGIREAIRTHDYEWAETETELLHNIPTLLEEPNVERHRYFWFAELEAYRRWVSGASRERPQSRMRTYYEPVWKEMEPILLEWFEQQTAAKSQSAI